jgi:antitoxin VapB
MKTVHVYQDGQNQTIRLPKEFQFTDENVSIKKVGNIVVLIPNENPWQSLFESLDQFTDDYMEERDQPPEQKREDIFT